VQFSPINATKVVSINDKKYIVAVGNDNVHEVFTGPKNGSLGEMIEIDDNFNFKRVQMDKSGLLIRGAAKQIEEIKTKHASLLLISQNNDSLLVYELKKQKSWLSRFRQNLRHQQLQLVLQTSNHQVHHPFVEFR